MVWESILTKALTGAVGGLSVGLSGFLRKPGVSFDWKKITPVVITALAIGALAGAMDLEYGEMENAALSGFVSMIAVNAVKAISRHLK